MLNVSEGGAKSILSIRSRRLSLRSFFALLRSTPTSITPRLMPLAARVLYATHSGAPESWADELPWMRMCRDTRKGVR